MRKRNDGIRKRCGCARKNWPKCPHPWHFNYKHGEVHYRFSLDREVGRRIEGKTEAEAEAERIRTEIRSGTFRSVGSAPHGTPISAAPDTMTFSAFAAIWKEQRGAVLAAARDDSYRLKTISGFVLPGAGGMTFGDKPLAAITTEDIEAFRDWRKTNGLSPVAVNHDLKLLRKMFNWSIRKRYLAMTPFKLGTEPAIALEREIPRNWRFEREEDEDEAAKGRQPAPSRHHHRNARHRLSARGNAVAAVAGCEPPTARDHDSPSQGENAHGEDHPDLHATGCDVGDEACASGWKGTPPGGVCLRR